MSKQAMTIPAVAALLLAVPAAAQAPAVPHTAPVGGPSLALSLAAAQAAIEACKATGYMVGVTVTDPAGDVLVSLSADGAARIASSGSRRKALLSAAKKASGAELVERVKSDPALAAEIKANPDWLAREGSLLIKKGDQIIGVIAVEGEPHDIAKNVSCAQAGIDKIQPRL